MSCIPLKSGVIPFNHPSLKGTSVQRMAHVIRNGYATPKAIELLNRKPELFINLCMFNMSYPTAEGYPRKIELFLNTGSLMVERLPSKDYTMDMIVEDGEFYFRTVTDEGRSLTEKALVECRDYPNSERALKIHEAVHLKNLKLGAKLSGERRYEKNRPVFVPSFSLKSFDQMSRMMNIFKLEQMDGVDLGSGIGSFGFQAANFFKTFTMIEIFKPLHERTKRLYDQLKKDGLLGENVSISNGDFFSNRFDITPYSFVYLFKPIYENGDKLVSLLKETKPGTLILSELFNDLYYDSAFEHVQMPQSLSARCNARLFRRLP